MQTRAMTEQDFSALQAAITRDAFHQGEWKVSDFIHTPESPKMCTVIEDSQGPIAFVRYTKTLRVSCVWNDAVDNHRNARAIIFGILDTVKQARANGFTEVVIEATNESLKHFLIKAVGMKSVDGECVLAV